MKLSKEKVCENVVIRKDKELNAIFIRDAILEYIRENKKPPSDVALAKKIGLHVNTIRKHMKEIKFESSESIYKVFTPDIIMSVINSSKKGSSASQKLYFQVVEGITDKSNINVSFDSKEAKERFESIYPDV